ncbi:MAG TPA: enoyl-CoA hydratase/isomerase family protein, partial [Caulobacteraceae bacterium]|nr:enoyl-CoA hydratase/isomerase family protein [Caulobacteraceae bacterium]
MAAPPALPDLDLRLDGAVAEVRLARPQARNALSHALMGQLIEAAAYFRASTEVQAIILTGTETYFSAGADLADPDRVRPRTRLEQRQQVRIGPDLCAAWEALEQVTIAAIEGYCIGGAAALAVALDFRIAGEGA